MGAIIARFKRQQTTIEVLEGIEKEITRLQRNRKENQDKLKKFVTSFLIYSIIVYIIAALVFFFLYFPETWGLRLVYSLPLLAFPFIIWGLKKLLYWYFVKRISSNDLALQSLREKKKQILEDVMETETYKKAREILEKFDPSRLRQLEVKHTESHATHCNAAFSNLCICYAVSTYIAIVGIIHMGLSSMKDNLKSVNMPQNISLLKMKLIFLFLIITSDLLIHQRNVQSPRGRQAVTPRMMAPPSQAVRQSMSSFNATPSGPRPQMNPRMSGAVRGSVPTGGGYVMAPGPPMPRSVLPRERGTMDRLMDYLVGDGPENRYALICFQCHSHNGMALKEEFEYLSFRCCYCYYINPARKQRPTAPRLEFFAPRGADPKLAAAESNEESDDDDVSDGNRSDGSGKDSLKSDLSMDSSSTKTGNPSADNLDSNSVHGIEKIDTASIPGGDPNSTGRVKEIYDSSNGQVQQNPKFSASEPPASSVHQDPSANNIRSGERHHRDSSKVLTKGAGTPHVAHLNVNGVSDVTDSNSNNNYGNSTEADQADADRSTDGGESHDLPMMDETDTCVDNQ
ncbi:unnamed protein product [Lymnaea stagnalis]|uniref:Endoplasmic reticulum junction formation protein lunapark n=1 Tax=Lymnaea stagnalis TaxID=6523 RepID=A0AAV2IFY7_LYMST